MPARNMNTMLLKGKQSAEPNQALLYARVSSKEQEKEGYSIAAQQRLLRDYAQRNGLTVIQEFIDVETAKQSGRLQFTAMLDYLKKHRNTSPAILVEKTDRLYRNFKDYTNLDDLGTTIHLVKEGKKIGPQSGSSDHLAHGFAVLMARNYVQNLSEETRKGMTEKARAGYYPSFAPVGYLNANNEGKRTIIPDPDTAFVITDIFERFGQGKHSIKTLVKELNRENITLRGRKCYSSTVHQILRKRLYSGDFDWDGVFYEGNHQALVSRETWQGVQRLLDTKVANRTRKVKHDFAYTGLVHCGHCGCLLVGELKKRKYVYYHCTGNRGKCKEPYTREDILAEKFANIFDEFIIPPALLEWLGDAVLESDRSEQAAQLDRIKKLNTHQHQIEKRIEIMYLDKLDGRITQEFFDNKVAAMRKEQAGLLSNIQALEKAVLIPIDDAIDMLRLTSQASKLFRRQPGREQRRLIQTVSEKASWKVNTLHISLFEPFEVLRHSNSENRRKDNENWGSEAELKNWLLR